MNYLHFKDLKVGDSVTILNYPNSWSSAAGGIDKRYKVKYPYLLTIDNITYNRYAWMPHIAIKDTNGFGWAINSETVFLFQRNNILINRKNRIENLNI